MSVKALMTQEPLHVHRHRIVRSKNIWTHWLPRAILVYNIDRTLNEAGHFTEVVDLIVQYKDHSEQATFHITGIIQTTIILGHTWLMEHNPEIDWRTGEISMMRCPTSCRLNTTEERNWLNHISAI